MNKRLEKKIQKKKGWESDDDDGELRYSLPRRVAVDVPVRLVAWRLVGGCWLVVGWSSLLVGRQ